MPHKQLIILDDGGGKWGPLADLRAVFEWRTGAITTLERIQRSIGLQATALCLANPLAKVVAQRTGLPVSSVPGQAPVLLVSGRWLGIKKSELICSLQPGSALLQKQDRRMVAALMSHDQMTAFIEDYQLPGDLDIIETDDRLLIERPWDILLQLEAALQADIACVDLPSFDRDSAMIATIGDHDIRVADTARLHPMAVINSEKGPVVIDQGAIIGSFAVVAGPCAIGAHTVISPHTHIRPHTVIGPRCVVAGEISNSILDGYTNKAHAGFLGHGIVGQWVNLGADTTVSNLKNTYGNVRMQLEADAQAEDAGITKLGPVIGDYVRTAIGTKITTGACIGTGTSLATGRFCPKFVERFSFITDAGTQRYDIEKFLHTARRAMARSDCQLTNALETRLRQVWAE